MSDARLESLLRTAPVVPVLVVEDAVDAVPLARALVRGGLRVLEVTLRTPAALDAIRAMAGVEGAIVGAGTVLTEALFDDAVAAGSRFVVSPGLTDGLAAAAHDRGVPLLPGAVTASEVMRAREAGFTCLKFFPAESSGGTAALRAFASVFPGVTFCPTGGIGAANAGTYLALGNVVCVGGSWVAPAEAVRARDWGLVETLAREAAALRAPR
jgi:2-dehydro-3-deoxyphosphogluconate aldolase/(4S)-4-hydroxy-2-oxoglutarate aldolase